MARGSSDVGVARRSRTHAVAPPTHLTGCVRPSPHGPPPSSEPPEGRAAPAPPARAPDPAPGAVPWGLLPDGWHDSTCRKVRNRCFWNTGQCHLSVETPEQRGCLGAPRGAERPRRALKTGPSTRSIASESRLLSYQETPSSHDQNAAAPSVAGAGRGQAPPPCGHRARDMSSPLGPWATAQDLSEAASRVSHWLVCLSWASCLVAGLACRRAAPWSCPLSPLGPAGGQPRLHRQGPRRLITPGPASPPPCSVKRFIPPRKDLFFLYKFTSNECS